MFVFFNAENGGIKLSIEQQPVGWAGTAEELAALLMKHDVNTSTDRIMHSSDVDFASEEGFATDGAAHEMIDAAFNIFTN